MIGQLHGATLYQSDMNRRQVIFPLRVEAADLLQFHVLCRRSAYAHQSAGSGEFEPSYFSA